MVADIVYMKIKKQIKNIFTFITGISSLFLLIYSSIRIVDTLSGIFASYPIHRLTILEKLYYIFLGGLTYLNDFMLAICGSVLIYIAYLVKNEADIPKPVMKIKTVVFSLLLISSALSFIRVVYFTVTSGGYDMRVMLNLVYFVNGLLTFAGIALFAVVILREIGNSILRKTVVIICTACIAGNLLISSINFVNMMINYAGIRGQFEMFGITQSMVNKSIWNYLLQLAIAAATLVVIIFGVKMAERKMVPIDEE